MKKTDHQDNVKIRQLWSHQTAYKFNKMCLGSLFRQSGLNLAVGGEDGIIRMYDLSKRDGYKKPQASLETKSGPIQTMAIHDVTRFYHNDLIAADSCGTITVFCNQQILCRKNVVNSSINCLQVDQEKTGNLCIVMSTESGVIVGVLLSSEVWRIDLNNLNIKADPGLHMSVTCLLATDLTNAEGQRSNYILAADDQRNLYVIHQGTIVMILKTASVITAMCHGKFFAEDRFIVGNSGVNTPPNSSSQEQVALGSQTGAIYIFHNFNVTEDEYANCGNTITNLCPLSLLDRQCDLLLCCGHFNAINMYSEGKSVGQYEMPDWINTIDKADLDSDGIMEIVVGCLDSSIYAIKILSS